MAKSNESDELRGAVVAYLNEYDNPAPDLTYRVVLRAHLRELVGLPLPVTHPRVFRHGLAPPKEK